MTSTATTVTTATPATPDRLLTPAFVLLGVGELAYFVADGMSIYLVPVHATGPLGSGRAGAGLAFGAFAISALLLRPLVGRICDTRGRRPLLVGGAATAAVALVLTAQVGSLAALVGLRLLAGVAEAGVFVAAFAAVADLAPPSRMGEAISYNSLALYLGLAAGPPLAEQIVTHVGFAGGWYGAAGLAVVAVAAMAFVGETGEPAPSNDEPAPLIHRATLPIALGFLTSILAMGGFLAFAGLHADAIGLAGASLPLAVYGSVVVVGRVAFARLYDRLPALPVASAALVTIAVGLVVMAAWRSPAGLLVGATVLALGVTFSTPAFFSAIFTLAPPSERGAASATASACIDLGFGGGPILLGLVAQSAGIPWAFAAGALVAATGAVWTWSRRSAR